MDLLWDGLREAFGLLVCGDPEVRAIAWRSIEISATATLLSLLAGVPAGVLLALSPAVMAGFGAVIAEVGASLMVGGNIRHSTRVLTTATVLETGKGNFEIAIALSIILLAITFAVNWVLTTVQQRSGRR